MKGGSEQKSITGRWEVEKEGEDTFKRNRRLLFDVCLTKQRGSVELDAGAESCDRGEKGNCKLPW